MIDDIKINKFFDLANAAIESYYNKANGLNLENYNETIYNHLEETYLTCLVKLIKAFLKNEPIDENINVEEYFTFCDYVKSIQINSEEIRKSLLMLWIQAFKDVDISLDLITPDTVGLIITNLLEVVKPTKKTLRILDPTVGTSNLIAVIANYLNRETTGVGIDSHGGLAELANASLNLMGLDYNIYFQDALQFKYNNFDCLVSDTATYEVEQVLNPSELYKKGVRYFPYLLIENYITIKDMIPYQFYVVDSDFFNQKGSKEFKEVLDQYAYIAQVIVLPQSMFKNPNKTRNIIVIKPLDKATNRKSTEITLLPSLYDAEALKKSINEIKNNIK